VTGVPPASKTSSRHDFLYCTTADIRDMRVIRGSQIRILFIFSETLPIFFFCREVLNTNERLEVSSPWHAVVSAKAAMTGAKGN